MLRAPEIAQKKGAVNHAIYTPHVIIIYMSITYNWVTANWLIKLRAAVTELIRQKDEYVYMNHGYRGQFGVTFIEAY